MLKVYKGESIHSIIYRTHVVNGISDFSNIVTSTGGWTSFPRILKNTLHLYEPIDDLQFLNLLRDLGLAKITNKMFKQPLAYRKELEIFFGDSNATTKVNQRTKKIKYCLKCIQEHIRDYGYGIFKSIWYFNDMCFLHDIPLNVITESKRKDVVLALAAIYRGEQPTNFSTSLYISESFYDPRKDYHRVVIDYIAPCLEIKFKKFIDTNRSGFSNKVCESVGFAVNNKYFSEIILSQSYMIEKIYNALKVNSEEVFIAFWKKHVESQTVYAGVINRQSISEKLYKEKNSNCQKCNHYSCGGNLSIIKPKTSPELLYKCTSSMWNIGRNAVALGIVDDGNRRDVQNLSKQKIQELHEMGEYWKTVPYSPPVHPGKL